MSDPNQRHPDSTFKATYPYNQSTITRGGHELQFNDTPDNESIKLAHTKGTYVEMESSGRWNQVVTEKLYSYIKSTMTQTVDSHYDMKVGGTSTLNIDQSSYEAVGLDKTTAVGGNLVDGVGGVRELHTESDKFESINGDSVVGIKGDKHTAVQGDVVTSITGVKSDTLESDWFVAAASSIEMNAEGTIRFKCKNFIIDAETITFLARGGPVVISAQSLLADIDATTRISSGNDTTIQSVATTIQSSFTDINGSPVRINGTPQVGN